MAWCQNHDAPIPNPMDFGAFSIGCAGYFDPPVGRIRGTLEEGTPMNMGPDLT